MEKIINLHIELLPEGVYLGTSEDMPGLIVQGNTVAEVVELAPHLVKALMEVQAEWDREKAVENAVESTAAAFASTAKPVETPLNVPLVVA